MDRVNGKGLMISLDTARAAVLAVLPGLSLFGHLPIWWTTTEIMLLGRLMGKVCGLGREVISVKREVVSHHTVQTRQTKPLIQEG